MEANVIDVVTGVIPVPGTSEPNLLGLVTIEGEANGDFFITVTSSSIKSTVPARLTSY